MKGKEEREIFEGPAWETTRGEESLLLDQRLQRIGDSILRSRTHPEVYATTTVSIIVPLRDAKRENVQSLMNSLTSIRNDNFEILLVAGANDLTWPSLPQEVLDWGGLDLSQRWLIQREPQKLSTNAQKVRVKYGLRLTIVEVTLVKVKKKSGLEEEWNGRDTNVKRNVGARLAASDLFAWTDGKNTHEITYLKTALELLQEHKVEALAGEMYAMHEEVHGFIPNFLVLYQEKGWIRRNPTFRKGYYLNRKTIKKVRTLPITACWFMTRAAYAQMQGFDERMTTSYEDFASAIKYVHNGGQFWVTNQIYVYHRHRKELKAMLLEWLRSGAGAADTLIHHPYSAFAWNRFCNVMVTTVLFIISIIAIVVLFKLGLLGAAAIFGGLVYVGLGSANAQTAGKWYGAFFPAMTVLLILTFSVGFWYELFTRNAAKRFLQMFFIPIVRSLS